MKYGINKPLAVCSSYHEWLRTWSWRVYQWYKFKIKLNPPMTRSSVVSTIFFIVVPVLIRIISLIKKDISQAVLIRSSVVSTTLLTITVSVFLTTNDYKPDHEGHIRSIDLNNTTTNSDKVKCSIKKLFLYKQLLFLPRMTINLITKGISVV